MKNLPVFVIFIAAATTVYFRIKLEIMINVHFFSWWTVLENTILGFLLGVIAPSILLLTIFVKSNKNKLSKSILIGGILISLVVPIGFYLIEFLNLHTFFIVIYCVWVLGAIAAYGAYKRLTL